MNPTIFIWLIYAFWLIVIVYLTVTAAGAKQDTKPHWSSSLAVMFAMIAAFVLPHVPIFSFVNFAPVNPFISSIGTIICLAGWIFFVWARQSLGKNWSGNVSAKKDHELVTSGPYRYIRHSMYTGGLIACIGSAIVVGGPFIFFLAFLTPIFIWRTGAEDKLMTRQFPNEYPDYMKRTKALIPFVW
jgi:protein-S-isoprenylcysteine O-methyltransferase